MAAIDTFRISPFRHNCAQAVANQWKELYPPGIVEAYAPYVGGRAPGGLCGALYAATQANGADAQKIVEEFEERAGARLCKDIKGGTGYPCEKCVALADALVKKYARGR